MPNNGDVTFKLTSSIWKLNKMNNGWQKEVNLVSWNNAKPRIDIRDWNSDRTKMKKGITLNKDEAVELRRCLNNIDLDFLYDDINSVTEVRTDPGPCGQKRTYLTKAEAEENIKQDIIPADTDEDQESQPKAGAEECEEETEVIM